MENTAEISIQILKESLLKIEQDTTVQELKILLLEIQRQVQRLAVLKFARARSLQIISLDLNKGLETETEYQKMLSSKNTTGLAISDSYYHSISELRSEMLDVLLSI